MQMFAFSSIYRFFAYLNILFVLFNLKKFKNIKDLYWLKGIFFFPLAFICLHFISVYDVAVIKEMRHIIISVFLLIGFILIGKKNRAYLQKNVMFITLLFVAAYIVGQLFAIFALDRPYGTTKNPHYLAIYSTICLIVTLYYFFRVPIKLKCYLGICIFILGSLLVYTSSRPAWIGALFSMLLASVFLNRGKKLWAFLGLIAIVSTLLLTDLGGFAEKSKDLIFNISNEERVVIWKETLIMQMDSSVFEWIFGHGLDSFEEDFKHYSSYHKKGIDFNSPHNYLLEILYISGTIGITLFIGFIWMLYKKTLNNIMKSDSYKDSYIMLFVILTTYFIFAGITLPFFYGYGMNIIAFVTGMIFYLEEDNKEQVHG